MAQAKTLDDVIAATAGQTSTIASLKAFIAGLRQMAKDALEGAPAQQAKIDALFSSTEANSAGIADAMVENVPPPVDPLNPASARR